MVDLPLDVVKATTQFVVDQALESVSWDSKDHLEDLKCLLEVVGKEKHDVDNLFVKKWLQKVTNVAYFVDNVMDDNAYEILCREHELGKNILHKNKVCTFFTLSKNPIVFRFRMTHKRLEILTKFDELDKEAKRIGLTPFKMVDKSTNCSHGVDGVERTNLERIRKNAIAFELFGRGEDMKKLLDLICSPNNDKEHLSTIAIVGLGGYGKTALTRHIYNNEDKVAKHFDRKMWVCVSENFYAERILRDMIEMLLLKKFDLSAMEEIIQQLQRVLKGKRFLLVLDDVWTPDKVLWNHLKDQLKTIEGCQGSVILVTTRSKEVAMSAGVGEPYELKALSEEESWSLFEQTVVNIPSSDHKKVGQSIVRKCNGHPLAIQFIGGLMHSKENLQDWEFIERKGVWDALSKSEMLQSLCLSYQHLPSLSLKQCFAYCATFPKDHIIEKNELIDLWIAQGFLKSTSKSFLTMEKTGEAFFNILLDISFLQLEEDKENATRYIWQCKMPHLVHDLAILVYKEDLFIGDVKDDQYTTVDYYHHFVLFNFKMEESKAFREDIIQQLRTINIWSGEFLSWNVLAHARYLRTLIMVGKEIIEVSPIIGNLKHLRYLDLSSNPLEILPDSICKLYQLQVLILLETRLRELPRELHNLVSLRRLTISGCVCQQLPMNDLSKLPNLRCLSLNNFHKVEYIGEEVYNSEHEDDHINESLGTTKGNNIDDECLQKGFFPFLRELRIRDFPHLKVLNLLPPTNATTSTTVDPFPCLEVLEIGRCHKLEVVKTSPVLSFKALKNLYLETISESHEPLDIIKYHKNYDITNITIKNTPEVTGLHQSLSYCSLLQTLHLEDYPNLGALPIGMSSLLSLKHLRLVNCRTLVSLPNNIFHGSNLTSLCELVIHNPNLVSLPDDMFKCISSLRTLEISCKRLEKIPTSVTTCTSLVELDIYGCISLRFPIPDLSKLQGLVKLNLTGSSSLLEWIPYLPHLQYLLARVELEIERRRRHIRHFSFMTLCCNDIDDIMTPPLVNQSLAHLTLNAISKNNQININSLPQQLLQLHLPSLKFLELSHFKELEILPEWIGTLSSLQELRLLSCKNLRCLPAKKHLAQLQRLFILRCPLLEERIRAKNDGPDEPESEWHKISHVPYVQINYKIV